MKTITISSTPEHKELLKEFPNFHKSGSIIGMKKLYYGKDALLIRCGSYIYNVSRDIYDRFNNS